MSIIQSSKIFHINSNNRLSGTQSNFTFKLDMPKNNNFDRVCVLECSIPKSYYLIQEGRNSFRVEDNGVISTITIPQGNYSRRSFMNVVNSLLPNHFEIRYNNTVSEVDTGKFLFYHNNTHGDQKIYADSFIYEQLGFDKDSINVFIPLQNHSEVYSKNVINFQRETTLFLHSDAGNNHDNDILLDVFSNGNPDYSTIVWRITDLESHSKPLVSNTNNVFGFNLTDENDVNIDLNGLPLLITLIMYKKNNISRMISGMIKYFLLKDDSDEPVEKK